MPLPPLPIPKTKGALGRASTVSEPSLYLPPPFAPVPPPSPAPRGSRCHLLLQGPPAEAVAQVRVRLPIRAAGALQDAQSDLVQPHGQVHADGERSQRGLRGLLLQRYLNRSGSLGHSGFYCKCLTLPQRDFFSNFNFFRCM